MLPKAADVREFWANIVNKVNGITEIPKIRFDADRYYDPDKKARDKMYSKWGGFLTEVAFDPMRYGIPPNALASIDPMQLLGLVAVEDALKDSGYDVRPFNRKTHQRDSRHERRFGRCRLELCRPHHHAGVRRQHAGIGPEPDAGMDRRHVRGHPA